jgi:hypothetical protein
MKNVQPKSILKNINSEFDGLLEEKDNLNSETVEDSSHHIVGVHINSQFWC